MPIPAAPSPKPQGFGVRLVRGPFVKLPPHPRHTDDEEGFLALAQDLKQGGARLAADLFSGAGGLSRGLEDAGFRVVFGADADPFANRTHAHHFAGMSVDWDLSDAANVTRVADLCRRAGVDLIAGGPPCQPFSRAGRSKIRHRVQAGLRDPHDERRDLWRSFLEVVSLVRPAAVIMENVPDMALDREMFILRSMVEELEQLGYSVEERVVETWRYGVPQLRQRLIMVALHNNVSFQWPEESDQKVTVWDAIGDLPEVEGGWRPAGGADGWAPYEQPLTSFQAEIRTGIASEDSHKVFDHITRPVRDDDRVVFETMTSKTKYTDLDAEHQRYRTDIFDDKYNRLDADDLSRTITAHIAKDGYWYIHPNQPRTLTVREAARLQTFPDSFRFDGPPSAAFRQIGNAVPPRLGHVLGQAVLDSLDAAVDAGTTTREIAAELSAWTRRDEHIPMVPWLWSRSRWIFLVAETLLDRAPFADVRRVWPEVSDLTSPSEMDAGKLRAQLERIRYLGAQLGRDSRAELVAVLAHVVAKQPSATDGSADELKDVLGVSDSVADLTVLSVPRSGGRAYADDAGPEEPVLVTKGVLRVAGRFQSSAVDRKNKMTDGRLAVARMIGLGEHSREAHRALIELASAVCRPTNPDCHRCPLRAHCHQAGVSDDQYALW